MNAKLFLKYLKSHRRIVAAEIIFCVIFITSFLLYHLPVSAVIYPILLCAAVGAVMLTAGFLHEKKEHETLKTIKSITDVIAGDFPSADGIKDEDYQELIRLVCREHEEYCIESDRKYSDMVDYYTVWAHQIKTPIASMRLHLQNEDSPLARTSMAELRRIEQYVEMVLTFLRLNSESTDYVIKEYDLDSIVRQSVRKFSSEFISRKLSLVYEPLETTVITDEKWLSFVIDQVLSNALKYTPSGSITITLEPPKTLRIRDTGIGIAPEDLPRIFENGYTGYNGRTDKKANGIGLYLCRRICKELGHSISAGSDFGKGHDMRNAPAEAFAIEAGAGPGTVIDIDLSQIKVNVE